MSEAKPYGLKDLERDGYPDSPEVFRARFRATVEKLETESSYAQNAVDKICHYRNLAIVLGAKPEQMLGDFDRKLCADGLDKDDTGNGYFMSVQECLDDVADTWGIVDELRAQIAALPCLSPETCCDDCAVCRLKTPESAATQKPGQD